MRKTATFKVICMGPEQNLPLTSGLVTNERETWTIWIAFLHPIHHNEKYIYLADNKAHSPIYRSVPILTLQTKCTSLDIQST